MSGETKDENRSGQGGFFWAAIAALIIIMLILGWYFGSTKDRPAIVGTDEIICEPIPSGMAWNGVQLVDAEPEVAGVSPIPTPLDCDCEADDAEAGWLTRVEGQLGVMGYPWMSLVQSGADIHVTGTVATEAEKVAAFAIAERLIANAPDKEPVDPTVINDIVVDTSSPEWAQDLEASVRALGFDWLNLDVRGPVATLSGLAPDEETRQGAFEMASGALDRNPFASAQISRIIDGITVEGGGDAGVADALVDLSSSDDSGELTAEACQTAFADTMAGRNIEFETASAELSSRSTRLLDALTGIAILCTDLSQHEIEIGGHTDARGAAGPNQVLSEQRAASVRAYLVGLGVAPDKLSAVGYGETVLLDEADTDEAHARNRRTEFTVMTTE